MRLKNHFRILIIASIVWFFFLILGFPDYYLQYSTKTMIWFDILLLIPFSIIIWHLLKNVKKTKRMKVSLWYSFYFTVPLAIYDYLYCGLYLGYGFSFVYKFWFLSIYYLILWIQFPAVALILNKRTGSY
ncbi:MAG: hypothetical protein DWQ10_04245 [Calditrichaeota bacterium]|nr:MAG: hypothetical protein DWQ10_04245 [Calditrichota bacterium]